MAEEFISLDTREVVPYSDAKVVKIEDKAIQGFNDQLSLKGESYSQYILFEADRFYDGIDLISEDLLLEIAYVRPDGKGDVCPAVNIAYSDTHVRFGWLIPSAALTEVGILKVMPFVQGQISNRRYILKTICAKYNIVEALQLGEIIEEPMDNWYQQFIDDIMRIGDFSTAIDNIIQSQEDTAASAQSAAESAATATEAKDTAVESAASAKEEADKAELYGTDLKNKVDSNTRNIAANTARIDSFIALPSESDIADAEIIDARVGLDGTVYDSLGTAIREQVGTLTDDMADEFDASAAAMQIKLDAKVDGAYVENGYLYLTSNNEVVAGPLGPFSGGGGSGGGDGGNNATLTLTNASGWLSKTIASGAECTININWSSTENDIPTGNGVLKVIVNGAIKAMLDVAQGPVNVEVSKYLGMGSNTVKMTISDVYANTRSINFTVNTVSLNLASTFDASTPKQGAFVFPYTPTGKVDKTVHFVVDGTEIGTQETTVSGRQQSYNIPAQTHGDHSLLVYFEAEINGETVKSNELYYDIICTVEGNDTVIISSEYRKNQVEQFSTMNIPFYVYDPNNLTTDITLSINNKVVSNQTVDRTAQTWTYRPDTYGAYTFKITAGSVSKTFAVTVMQSSIAAKAETEDLSLYLTSSGRSNNEENPGVWTSGNVSVQFTGFNYVSDGWVNDPDGITVLRVSGDARVSIPYRIFAQDFRTTGKTIEIEFSTRDVLNYDAVVLSCLSGGRGLQMTAQLASLASEQSYIQTQYKEDDHVRLTFVVEKRSENRLVYCYINGVMSGVVQYPDNDDFSQANPVDITIGSNECTTDIYCIRVYDNDLTRQQILDNWIADTQNVDQMLARYNHNNVYDEYGNIVIAKLPNDLPYMIITCPQLPQYKGDKKTVEISYTDPVNAGNSFTATGVQLDVQGTSSQYYARKNYKAKYKSGFDMTASGEHVSKYKLRTTSIPANVFTYKADVASSEGANNVELVRLYNDTCPYKTPAQVENPNVRQGIDGYPIVMFWNDGDETTFLGKLYLPK